MQKEIDSVIMGVSSKILTDMKTLQIILYNFSDQHQIECEQNKGS